MEPAAIVAEGVSKSFGAVQALDKIDLAVAPGTVLGLLGPNGAGKTTAVRILTTLLAPDAGRALVAGHDVVHEPHRVRGAIGLAGQYAAVDENLTGRENLELVARLYHFGAEWSRGRARELLQRFDLVEAADRLVRTYSGGMRRRLDLAASLVSNPKILFLDEPTTGLDPRSRIALWQEIKRLVAEGMTVLLTTQYLEEADHLATSIAVIDRGRIIAQGTAEELKSQVGGDVLEIKVRDRTDLTGAAEAMSLLTTADPKVNADTGTVTIPAGDGASVVVEAVRILDDRNVAVADLVLRRPTLDDVFLALTGHATSEEEPTRGRTRKRRSAA